MPVRLLFVGQAPSKETVGQPVFSGRCGTNLAKLLRTSQDQMLVDHDFRNVLNYWPGAGRGGDLWPLADAKVQALGLLHEMQDRTVILLGSNVARAFGASVFSFLRWYEFRDPRTNKVVTERMAVCPHPSGVNRWWNSQQHREMARRFFDTLLKTEEAILAKS